MAPDSIESITQTYLDAIEAALKQAVERSSDFADSRLHDMLTFHMGWQDNQARSTVRGKRIRPLLVLLSCSAAGGDWMRALPAAAAVELVHNFSLIHDDIEDQSPLRRGRPTVWKQWGIAQAINTGDAMFALAHLEAVRLSETVSPSVALKAVEILQSTCLHLTQGQYLDLSYESRADISIDNYWHMVEGKTAALVSTSTELGAMTAFANEETCDIYRKFGRLLGMAFQIQDDLLGIWGNSSMTGKSSQSDLVTGKKTLPILYGISLGGEFARRWKDGAIKPEEVPGIIKLLEIEGSKEFSQAQANHYINNALSIIEQAHPTGIAGEALKNLATSLVNRQT